jgi:hypothetical protein
MNPTSYPNPHVAEHHANVARQSAFTVPGASAPGQIEDEEHE